MNNRIFIPINSLSALIGRHPHRDQYEETTNIICRYYPDINNTLKRIYQVESCYRDKLTQLDLMSRLDDNKTYRENYIILVGDNEDIVIKNDDIDIIKASKELEIELEESLNNNDLHAAGAARSKMDDLAYTIKDCESYTSKIAKCNIKQFKCRYLGRKRENDTVIKLFEKGKDIRDEQKVYKIDQTTPNGIPYRLYGKIDGIEYIDGKPTAIVEIKNRMMRFQLPEYDLDQLSMYIYMSGLPYGYLVQQLNDEISIDSVITYAQAKKRYEENIVPYMYGWIDMMKELPIEYSDKYSFEIADMAMGIFDN